MNSTEFFEFGRFVFHQDRNRRERVAWKSQKHLGLDAVVDLAVSGYAVCVARDTKKIREAARSRLS